MESVKPEDALADRLVAPNWDRVQLNGPFFIIGHQRTGSTLLHRTLATDPNAIEALVCFRDDPAGYQGIFSLDPDAPDDRIPMSDADVRSDRRTIDPVAIGPIRSFGVHGRAETAV